VAEAQLGPVRPQLQHVAVVEDGLLHRLAGQERSEVGTAILQHDLAVPLED